MKRKVQQYITKHNLFTPNDKIIVAISGGADSTALLHILLSLNYECIAAHCNFHLRGEESDRDEQFVAELARKYGIKLLKTDFDTKQYAAEQKISIEMAARDLRYRWFEEIAVGERSQTIAVAHHQDDTAETILMNLTRGTGINGLTGIKPRNGNIVRPLLCVSRKEIMAYIHKNKLQYVEDSSNADTQFTRNYFRNRIIPAFEKINPSFVENLLQTAEHLNDVAHIYNQYIKNLRFDFAQRPKNGNIQINIARLKREPASILYEILKDYGFNAAQCTDILSIIDGESGKQFFSPTHRLIKDRDFLIISPLLQEECEKELHFEKLAAGADLQSVPKFKIDKSPNIAYLDSDKIIQALTLRHWQAGDTFYPFGMKGKKKVSDYFTDKKFTLQEKENAWLLVSGADIVWIVGERIDDRFKITADTKNILKVSF
ncbi:MAG: tRNA lysidine(34) synthetase TilS [Prevotellaceae bacterium]|jgi:tRNA(Ile)-lysidine synthase|nr:tRNA lysidine(34) synthetase TilS [Prevotellaceae bacterium]